MYVHNQRKSTFTILRQLSKNHFRSFVRTERKVFVFYILYNKHLWYITRATAGKLRMTLMMI